MPKDIYILHQNLEPIDIILKSSEFLFLDLSLYFFIYLFIYFCAKKGNSQCLKATTFTLFLQP